MLTSSPYKIKCTVKVNEKFTNLLKAFLSSLVYLHLQKVHTYLSIFGQSQGNLHILIKREIEAVATKAFSNKSKFHEFPLSFHISSASLPLLLLSALEFCIKISIHIEYIYS